MKWAEKTKIKLDEDTAMTNRVMFTVQRVCDNAENNALYAATDPTQNFLLARVEEYWSILVFLIQYVLWGRIVMYCLPRLIVLGTQYALPHALRGWVSLFLSILNAMLSGSSLLCYEMIYNPFSGLGVMVVILAALSTFLCSIRQKH
jgi:hypothetical protein